MVGLMEPEKRQQSRVVFWGACLAGAMMLGGLITAGYLGIRSNLYPTSTSDASTGIGTGTPAQQNAENVAAKSDPAGLEDPTGGRARSVKMTSRDLHL
jgi:hypothetical protein